MCATNEARASPTRRSAWRSRCTGDGVVRAEASAIDRETAFDVAYNKLTAQLRKMHERKVHRHQGKLGLRAVPTPASGTPVITADTVDNVEMWEGAPRTRRERSPSTARPS